MNTVADLTQELLRLSKRLDGAQQELVQASVKWAEKERDYRKAKAVAFAAVRNDKLMAADREAQVDSAIADTRYHRDLAEGAKVSATEAVRNLRSQINAVQSIGAAIREEMRLAS